MSDLEGRAKSLLIALIDGKRSLFALAPDERALVAFWAAKTAYLIAHTAVQQDRVGVDHLRSLARNGTLSPSVCVAARQHPPTGKASFLQKNTWPHAHPDPYLGIPLESSDGYKIGMQFGHLLLVVAHQPGDAQYLLAAGLHVPLWPTEALYPSYYSGDSGVDITPDMDSRVALERFSTGLAVIHKPPRGIITIPQFRLGR